MFGNYISKIFFVLASFLILWVNDSCTCCAQNGLNGYEEYFEVSRDTADIDLSRFQKGDKYVINETIDLKNKTLYMPTGISIVMKGGVFKNGCIVGNETRLNSKQAVFDRVHIAGSWVVPKISTTMFRSLAYDNSLKDVLALASPEVRNRIYVAEGEYKIIANYRSDRCLSVPSNTKLLIDGFVFLTPNDFISYHILHITGENITVKGNGCIVGDKPRHRGNSGEWGMGVSIEGGKNVTIAGLTIKDCWGDCIYISRNAKNIVVKNCVLDNGRRQGISIISANDVSIKNCKIKNVTGTNPAYGIDVEPNEGDTVKHVTIDNVEMSNCWGGIESNGYANGSSIESIRIRNCVITKTKRCPLRFRRTDAVQISGCNINGYKKADYILLADIDSASVADIRVDDKKKSAKEELRQIITSDNVNTINFK